MHKTEVLTKNMYKTGVLTKRIWTKQTCLQKRMAKTDVLTKNICTKQTCLQKIFRQNRRAYKKPRFTDSSRYEENQKATKENLEEEVKRLKNEVAYLKKDHITPPQHFLLTRKQILTVPPSKPLPQKILHDNSSS